MHACTHLCLRCETPPLTRLLTANNNAPNKSHATALPSCPSLPTIKRVLYSRVSTPLPPLWSHPCWPHTTRITQNFTPLICSLQMSKMHTRTHKHTHKHTHTHLCLRCGATPTSQVTVLVSIARECCSGSLAAANIHNVRSTCHSLHTGCVHVVQVLLHAHTHTHTHTHTHKSYMIVKCLHTN